MGAPDHLDELDGLCEDVAGLVDEAKYVRRRATLLVQAAARTRDRIEHLQAEEVTRQHERTHIEVD